MTDARRLASTEVRQLVRWLLEHSARTTTAASFLDQVDKLHVIDSCDCGCPSVDFIREGMGAGAQILADATGEAQDGLSVAVLLWGRDGAISGLEVFDYDGGPWFPLPPVDRLRPSYPIPET